jgi:triosephosphate isomerase
MALPPFIVGNWKMNGTQASLAEARLIDQLAAHHPQVDVGITPPFTLVGAMALACQTIKVGAQDCHAQEAGAYTGNISAPILADAGASFVLVGHSERRAMHRESDSDVKAKAQGALASGLLPIICVGECESDRLAGLAEATILAQLEGSLPDAQDLPASGLVEALCIGYEPVWAVGTGRVPSVAQVEDTHGAIHGFLLKRFGDLGRGMRILYGGSVTGENAGELLAAQNVGGALVGGASLSAAKFGGIIAAAAALAERVAAE